MVSSKVETTVINLSLKFAMKEYKHQVIIAKNASIIVKHGKLDFLIIGTS